MNPEIKIVTNEMVDEKFIADLKNAFSIDDDNPDWDLEVVKKFVDSSQNKFLVAFVDDQIAGFLYGYTFDRMDNKRQKFYIHELGTKPEFQHQGVMTAMINYLVDELKKDGLAAVWILTDPENIAAINLYNKTIGNPKDQIMFGKDF